MIAITQEQAIGLSQHHLGLATIYEEISRQPEQSQPQDIPVPRPSYPPGVYEGGYVRKTVEGINSQISQRVKVLETLGLKRSVIASIAGVSASTLSRWVNGDQSIRRTGIAQFNKMCTHFNIDPVEVA